MIYTHVDDTQNRLARLLARAPYIQPAPDRGYLPVLLADPPAAHGLGAAPVCRIDDVLRERINIRALGLSFTIGDILRLAADTLGYNYTTPATLCAKSVEQLEDAIAAALQKLVRTAVAATGIDCSNKNPKNWKDILASVARNIQLSGSNNGLSISIDWAGLGVEFLQYVVCAALNSAVQFVGRIASDLIAVVDKLKQRCTACLRTSTAQVSRSGQALTQDAPPGSAAGPGGSSTVFQAGYGSQSSSKFPLVLIGAATAGGAFWIWRRRRRR